MGLFKDNKEIVKLEIRRDNIKNFYPDQLSKIIEPIRSRCILLRTKLPSSEQILDILNKTEDKLKHGLEIQSIAPFSKI